MPDFFGKSGNAWVGIQYIVKPSSDSNSLTCIYYDGFTNDKKEDSFSSLSFLEVAQGHFFVKVFPEIFPEYDVSQGIFYNAFLDGAGCYVSIEQLLTRLAFSERINVYMKSMFIPEAYFNKTSLDSHFATAGKQMRASVAAGAGKNDAFDAASMFTARTSEIATGTVCKTVATLRVCV